MKSIVACLSLAVALLIAGTAHAQLPDIAAGKKIVKEERAKYPSNRSMSAAEIVELLKSIAHRMNAERLEGGPFGVLVKTGGAQCNGYACDIICTGNGSAQKQWDVLGDADPAESDTPGRQSPDFGEPLSTIAIRVCEFEKIAPPPSTVELERQLAEALAAHAAALRERDEARGATILVEIERDAAKKELAAIASKPAPSCTVSGPGWVRAIFGISCSVQ
jgi:hypothetical protein